MPQNTPRNPGQGLGEERGREIRLSPPGDEESCFDYFKRMSELVPFYNPRQFVIFGVIALDRVIAGLDRVAKALEGSGGDVSIRLDEQDRKLEAALAAFESTRANVNKVLAELEAEKAPGI